jgi:transcriptional regulator with XRE-family HTH domain
MPRSLRVRHDYIDKVRVAVARNGYPNQRALAHDTGLSRSTVSKFMTGNPVDYATFEELCRRLNLDWQEITISAEVIFTPSHTHKYAKKNQI